MTTTPTVGILGTIRQLLMAVVQLLVVFTAAMLFALSAPLLYTVGVEWLIWKNPHDLTFGVPYFLFGPFVCSIWMLVIVHFHSIRQWTREGRLATWKQDHGGFWKTNMKATRFLFMGFFGSAFAETVFFLAGLKVFPNGIVGDRASAMLYFALAPFAVFAPCWICLVWRSIRGDEKERYDPLATDE